MCDSVSIGGTRFYIYIYFRIILLFPFQTMLIMCRVCLSGYHVEHLRHALRCILHYEFYVIIIFIFIPHFEHFTLVHTMESTREIWWSF